MHKYTPFGAINIRFGHIDPTRQNPYISAKQIENNNNVLDPESIGECDCVNGCTKNQFNDYLVWCSTTSNINSESVALHNDGLKYMKSIGAIPHTGKFLGERSDAVIDKKYLKQVLGDNVDKFLEIRGKIDPHKKMINKYDILPL